MILWTNTTPASLRSAFPSSAEEGNATRFQTRPPLRPAEAADPIDSNADVHTLFTGLPVGILIGIQKSLRKLIDFRVSTLFRNSRFSVEHGVCLGIIAIL